MNDAYKNKPHDWRHNKIWNIVERKNFRKDLAAWEEHRVRDDVSYFEAQQYIDDNPDRILCAYVPHPSGGGMCDITCNWKYVESCNLENKWAKIID